MLATVLALWLIQEKPPEIKVRLSDGEDVAGTLRGVEADGSLDVETASGRRTIRAEAVQSIAVSDEVAETKTRDELRFNPGGGARRSGRRDRSSEN